MLIPFLVMEGMGSQLQTSDYFLKELSSKFEVRETSY